MIQIVMRGTTGQSREALLQDFVTWSAAHISGDEKGEAQIFLDRLFRAFGQKGSLDVGGTAEMRIRKASEDGGGAKGHRAGLPPSYPNPKKLATEDCIEP